MERQLKVKIFEIFSIFERIITFETLPKRRNCIVPWLIINFSLARDLSYQGTELTVLSLQWLYTLSRNHSHDHPVSMTITFSAIGITVDIDPFLVITTIDRDLEKFWIRCRYKYSTIVLSYNNDNIYTSRKVWIFIHGIHKKVDLEICDTIKSSYD